MIWRSVSQISTFKEEPASVNNNLNLLLLDEIKVWVENLVRLYARDLLNLNWKSSYSNTNHLGEDI